LKNRFFGASSIKDMTVAAQKQLAKQILALPEKDRARLAHLLIKSLDAPVEELGPEEWTRAWKTELKKRIDDIRSGKVKTIPADRVMAELKAKYG
jgi:putative addiction module component (TIGR02574 family)